MEFEKYGSFFQAHTPYICILGLDLSQGQGHTQRAYI